MPTVIVSVREPDGWGGSEMGSVVKPVPASVRNQLICKAMHEVCQQ